MGDVLRTCRRTGCRGPAAASLSFRYASRQAWLLGLAEEPDPVVYDLCPHHSDTLSVPRGWELVDERTPATVAEAGSRDQPGTARRGPRLADRYAALNASLPSVAAEYRARCARGSPAASEPVPSRDLSPPVPAPAESRPVEPRGSAVDPTPELEGQLAMPLQRHAHEVDGVVVAMRRAARSGAGVREAAGLGGAVPK